jgi:hypothetical protein
MNHALFSTGLLPALALALTSSQKPQKPAARPPVLVFVLEEQVRPGCMKDYIDCTKTWIELMRDVDPKMAFSAFGDAESFVEFNERIGGFEDIGRTLGVWAKFTDMLPGTEWGRKRLAAVSRSRYSVWQRSAELSFEPATPHPDPRTLTYFEWGIVRLRPDMEGEFFEAGIRIRELFQESGINRGYSVFRNVIGYEGPTYSVIFAGRDPAEFDSWRKKSMKELSPRLPSLLRQLAPSIVDTQEIQAWSRPELSLPGR